MFMERSGGVASSDSLRYHRKHSATGVLLHLSRDRGGGTICPKTITLQHVIVGQLILGAVIFTGDLSDFRTVISGKLGPPDELISGAVT